MGVWEYGGVGGLFSLPYSHTPILPYRNGHTHLIYEPIVMNTRTALLLGATGLVGGHCLDLLLADATYEAVVTLGRRPLRHAHPKLTHHVVDFDRLADAAAVRQVLTF